MRVADKLVSKKRRKLDQYIRGVREDPEIELQEMTNLSNRFFRLLVGIIFTAGLLMMVMPFKWTSGWPAVLGVALVLFLVNGLGWLLVSKLHERGFDRPASFNQLIFLILLTMLLSKCVFELEWPALIAPLPMLAMVMALTLGQRVASFLVIAASFYLGLSDHKLISQDTSLHVDLVLVVAFSLGGLAAVLGMSRVRQQSRPVVVGAYAGIVQALIVLAFKLIAGKPGTGERFNLMDFDTQEEVRAFLENPAWALAGGLISGAVVTCFLPVLERFFGIVTERRLLALTDPNHELLQALRNCAPGTHTHTLRVADLASAAAEAIGADSLLARVGAYYHDIGKIAKPEYFVENKDSSQNIHDRLRPSMSKLVIISHVKEGVELAEEAGIPRKVIDMIPMHHGTTLVEYFFHKAKTEGEPVKAETEYRYPGPRPHFKEAGILMLADGVEAAAKTIAEPNPSRFRAMAHDLILKRLIDHQLDESDLTMRDLTRIEDSFVRTLTYMYHGRIKYPSDETAQVAKYSGLVSGANSRGGPGGPPGRRPEREGPLAGAAPSGSVTGRSPVEAHETGNPDLKPAGISPAGSRATPKDPVGGPP